MRGDEDPGGEEREGVTSGVGEKISEKIDPFACIFWLCGVFPT